MKGYLLALFIPGVFSANAQQFQKTINFENDESLLDNVDMATIAEIAAFVNDATHLVSAIEIYGYADTNASLQYNIGLSQKRAQAVGDELNKLLSAALHEQISVNWYGEVNPDVSVTNLNYAKRCVDIVVMYETRQVVSDHISDLYEMLRDPVQKFSIDPTRDTILNGEAGTIVMISANSFYIPKSCEGQDVDIILQESYDPVSMFVNHLTTTSGGEQLESDGMIFLNAQLCNRVLTVKEDKPLTVMFPTTELKDSMQLFSGSRDAEGNINWRIDPAQLNQMSTADLARMLSRSDFYKRVNKKECPLFFCGVKKVFGGSGGERSYTEYKYNYRAYRTYMDSICKVYGVANYYQLMKLLEQQRMAKTESNLSNGDITMSDWNYYVASTADLGWMNCDKFMNTPEFRKTDLIVAEIPAQNISASLVFTRFKSMLAANGNTADSYRFNGIKKNEECYLIMLRYENKTPYMSINKINTSPGLVIEPEFRAYTVDEMKKELKRLM